MNQSLTIDLEKLKAEWERHSQFGKKDTELNIDINYRSSEINDIEVLQLSALKKNCPDIYQFICRVGLYEEWQPQELVEIIYDDHEAGIYRKIQLDDFLEKIMDDNIPDKELFINLKNQIKLTQPIGIHVKEFYWAWKEFVIEFEDAYSYLRISYYW